jgi:uncharacterized paraquat-inducible protein A
MSSAELSITVVCPCSDCKACIDLPAGVEKEDMGVCPQCKRIFVIKSLEPPALEPVVLTR